MNKLARECLDIAKRRGKVQEDTTILDFHIAIESEVIELIEASFDGKPSEVIPFSHEEEEAADVIIATLSFLEFTGCSNIEELIRSKVKFNSIRE